jgi:hypothetical protein
MAHLSVKLIPSVVSACMFAAHQSRRNVGALAVQKSANTRKAKIWLAGHITRYEDAGGRRSQKAKQSVSRINRQEFKWVL